MTTIAISGHFDPFHPMHLDYIRQAMSLGDHLVCIVGSDKQLLMKKGRYNIPEEGRREIVELILEGLGINSIAVVNTFDTETTLVANALRYFRPDVFCRGGDKTPGTIPPDEVLACQQHNIKVAYAEFKQDMHSSRMLL